MVLRAAGPFPSPSITADWACFWERSQAAHASRSTRSSFSNSLARIVSKFPWVDCRHSASMIFRSPETVDCAIWSFSAMAVYVQLFAYRSAICSRRRPRAISVWRRRRGTIKFLGISTKGTEAEQRSLE